MSRLEIWFSKEQKDKGKEDPNQVLIDSLIVETTDQEKKPEEGSTDAHDIGGPGRGSKGIYLN